MKIQCFHSSSLGNLYSVSDGKTRIMIECGVEFKEIQKCFDFSVSALAGCLVTHEHGDHAKSWKDVARYAPVYMLNETAEALGASGYNIKNYSPLKALTVGTFDILPIPAAHDVPCSSFVIKSTATNESLLFATDTAYLRHVIRNVNYAMVECNYDLESLNKAVDSGALEPVARNRIVASHCGLETTLKIISGINQDVLKEIHLLHLSSRHADGEYIQNLIESKTGKPVYIAGE